MRAGLRPPLGTAAGDGVASRKLCAVAAGEAAEAGDAPAAPFWADEPDARENAAEPPALVPASLQRPFLPCAIPQCGKHRGTVSAHRRCTFNIGRIMFTTDITRRMHNAQHA